MNNNNNYNRIPQAEWAALPNEKQLETDPDRVLWDIFSDEQRYALSQFNVQEAQVTPSRVPSPADSPTIPVVPLIKEKHQKEQQEEDEEVDEEDSSEVNYHNEGLVYNPVRPIETTLKKTHRLPVQLLNIRSNHWFGTHNSAEYLDTDELTEVCTNNMAFIEYFVLFEEEAPTTGHKHYHSILVLRKQMLAHIAIEIDPCARWEKMNGTLRQAYKYAAKENKKYFEWGIMPNTIVSMLESEEKKSRKRSAPTKTEELWKQMVQRAKAGDLSVRDEQIYARYRMYFDDILAASHQDKVYNGDLKFKNLWIFGPPGTGKSRMVWEYARDNNMSIYVKNQNKWWDGYNGQDIVLIDDAGETMKLLSSHVKNWGDRYPFSAEVKGGSRRINSADFFFIVTSNYSIEEIFNATDSEAILRRFDVLEMK